jgi:hypothetical protein
MGGLGSGSSHYCATRGTVESCLRLDVRRLQRQGLLQAGVIGTSSWTRSGRPSGSIEHVAVGDKEGRASALLLQYTAAGEPVEQVVELDWTPCNYGGERPWMLCPLCGRRVAILYAGARFYCRHCHRLAYSSTREDPSDRGITKAQNIRKRLGGSANLFEPFPPKPKGMHWKTYWRLRDEANAAYLGGLQFLMGRLDGLRKDRGGRR